MIVSQETMPATRPHLDRDLKRAQILDAAETLFLRDGYETTAMAAIARRAGVANNAVYWYFSSKDDLLAAMLRRYQERVLAQMPTAATATVEEQVLAMLAQLDQVAILTASVHERAQHSAAVAEMHEAFHAAADRLLEGLFREAGLKTGRRDASREGDDGPGRGDPSPRKRSRHGDAQQPRAVDAPPARA